MKRLVCVLSIMLMMFGIAIGEGIDLKSMGIEELMALRSEITDELKSRITDESNEIYEGTYTVGKDIKAGTYLITVNTVFFEYASYALYADAESHNAKKTKSWGDMPLGRKMKFELEDGMVFELRYGVFTLVPYPSQSWAP